MTTHHNAKMLSSDFHVVDKNMFICLSVLARLPPVTFSLGVKTGPGPLGFAHRSPTNTCLEATQPESFQEVVLINFFFVSI